MSTDEVTLPVEGAGVGSMTVVNSGDGTEGSGMETDDVDMSVVVEVDVELEVEVEVLMVSDAEEDTADMVLLLTDGTGTNMTAPA